MNLDNIKLSEQTKQNLLRIGYNQLTDIQQKVIPVILEGKDVIAQSRTGSGKTAGFIIPTIEKLRPASKPQVLVLVPTRELALQVSEETKKLSQNNSKLRVLAVYGGDPIDKQLRSFRQGVDIIIGTPGRVIDHITKKKSFQTGGLKFVILDEADEMINKGFLEDIKTIIETTPINRQTLLFSATISPQVAGFSKKYLKNPERIEGESGSAQNDIQQYYLEAPYKQKSFSLINLLLWQRPQLAIIFANTKKKVEEIKEVLGKTKLVADYIHSDLSQSRRNRVIQKFRDKQINLLVATDVAARGLDISGVSYVINYELPQSPEFYVHRIGRTGRAGSKGKAITFISQPKEKRQLITIVNRKGYKIERLQLPEKIEIEKILRNELIEKIVKKIENNYTKFKRDAKLNELVKKHGDEEIINILFELLLKKM